MCAVPSPLRLLAAAACAAVCALTVGAPAGAADGDRVGFTGTFVGQPTQASDGSATRYQVEVDAVYGPTDVPRRVTVESRVALESCRPPGSRRGRGLGGGAGTGPGTAQQEGAGGGLADEGRASTQSTGSNEPLQPTPTESTPTESTPTEPTPTEPTPTVLDKRRRFFAATERGDLYVVAGCARVRVAQTPAALAALEPTYGEPRPPGIRTSDPSPVLDDVGYLCPETRDAVDLADPASCGALEDEPDFDRSAAPGAALVLVGLLGLLLARRLGRRG
jgi:hypothetical protein